MEKSADLAIKHNIFGGVCLKAGQAEKSIQHFRKALEMVPEGVAFSNAHVNLANALVDLKRKDEAMEHFQAAIDISPHNRPQIDAEPDTRLNAKDALSEAYSNLAVLYMGKDDLSTAQALIHRSIELNPLSEANINLGNILRQLGRRSDAIDHAWSGISSIYTEGQFSRPSQLDPKQFSVPCSSGPLHVVCVKWGKKYGPEYVNRLYHGVCRYLTAVAYDFSCFTENPDGLDAGILVVPLAENWTGWWGKATLFGDTGLEGRMLYIDLDTVITGSLDDLAQYAGAYAVMGTGDLECEKAKDGYNTSIIAWHSEFGKEIYLVLKKYYVQTVKFICRFDFWTEMMVTNADIVQELFPGQFLDYLTYCKETVPEGCRMVCFPRDPKPHEYPSEWIRDLWV
jgi:hypothetical protein